MNKNLRVGLGVLLVLMGMIWTMQGLGYLKGSPMTSVTLWAIIGPVVALAGLALAFGKLAVARHRLKGPSGLSLRPS